ncbi:MAG: dTDP-4-dehydrorhamnose 3,5-epimerase [Alphaproteobacteria bacterium]|nr:MAG: dTDP-4-dehydrorhamnose 3,5-epimerase [Alphaproteobacteria bacterium]
MFQRLSIPDVFVFTPKRFGDDRGFFVETYNRGLMEPMTGPLEWLQDNHSRSDPKFTVRALHFQTAPFAQDKLVRCIRGSVLDVAVDIRHGSPTFGKHVSARLTEAGGEQIFVPKGFAHGFVTLQEGCEISYKVSNYYSPAHDRNICWNDPSLNIDWGVRDTDATLSSKDIAAPLLADTPIYFRYGG